MTGDLFPDLPSESRAGDPPSRVPGADAPLAERLRPRTLDEIVGQKVLAPDGLLRRTLARGRVPSLILWGPPGTGKTTLAKALASEIGQAFVAFSAVLSGVKEVREIVAEARRRRADHDRGTVLFVDEIHRFNRAQQDAFLPHVEDGTIVLVGATTENPSFHLNGALLSRCLVLVLEPLSDDALVTIGVRALEDAERGLGSAGVRLSERALRHLARLSHGDARSFLNQLDSLVHAASMRGDDRELELEDVGSLLQRKPLRYDRAGDEHYDLISAFQKSIRGSDPQATLYWMARMLEAGEEPLFLARRLIRIAAEDVGLADPQALVIAVAAKDAYAFLGTPEGELALVNAAVYLATTGKSDRTYAAYNAVVEEVRAGAVHPVPLHLRNAPTRLMKDMGHGKGYVYPPGDPEGARRQTYLPPELSGRRWYVAQEEEGAP